jgi:hypothetical protein
MWGQLISMRLKEGAQGEITGLMDALDAAEQPGSGLLRSITMTEQNDPRQVHVLVVFESEENARTREDDPRRQEALVPVRQKMAEIFESPPSFADLTVVVDRSYQFAGVAKARADARSQDCDQHPRRSDQEDRGDTGGGVVLGGRRGPHG